MEYVYYNYTSFLNFMTSLVVWCCSFDNKTQVGSTMQYTVNVELNLKVKTLKFFSAWILIINEIHVKMS